MTGWMQSAVRRVVWLGLAVSVVAVGIDQRELRADSIYPNGPAVAPDWFVEGKAAPEEYLLAQQRVEAAERQQAIAASQRTSAPEATRSASQGGRRYSYQPAYQRPMFRLFRW